MHTAKRQQIVPLYHSKLGAIYFLLCSPPKGQQAAGGAADVMDAGGAEPEEPAAVEKE